MTRCNVNQRLKLAVARAAEAHPSLAKRHVSPCHMVPYNMQHQIQRCCPEILGPIVATSCDLEGLDQYDGRDGWL
jgi:hypothetical protein